MNDAPPRTAESVRAMFAGIARRYDLANHLLSWGCDFAWRRKAGRTVAAWGPSRVLDLATGSGDLAIELQRVCPAAEVTGADFCEPMLAEARRKGLERTVVADALALPFGDAEFDVVTVSFGLRNMASYSRALSEMARVLRPGGHVLVLDFSVPRPPLRWLYRPYLQHVLPRLAAWVTGDKTAYEYLGASIENFPQGAAMCGLLCANGFAAARCEPLTGGIVSLYTATRAAGDAITFPAETPRSAPRAGG